MNAMKLLSLIISTLVLAASTYFFAVDFKWTDETNHLIYMGMLLTLMFICILGIIVNTPWIRRSRKKVRTMIYNSYSDKRIKNKSFDRQLEML